MATRNGGPACPKVERLEELMEALTLEKDHSGSMPHTCSLSTLQRNELLQEIVEALDWLHTSLSNRKSYHQKRQAEQKLFMETARKLLSKDELEAITKQAEREING